MAKPVLIANSHKRGGVHHGGGNNFAAMQKDLHRRLVQDRGHDAFFTSMIDLYALPKGFPGSGKARESIADPYQRVNELERSWADKTNDRRFIPHIQLHEYEAYLFADISILSEFYNAPKIEKLRKSIKHLDNPELIDDGPQTAPSKRIIQSVPRYEGDKATVGVQAVERIGLATTRDRCPHFAKWPARLESLGTRAKGDPR